MLKINFVLEMIFYFEYKNTMPAKAVQ